MSPILLTLLPLFTITDQIKVFQVNAITRLNYKDYYPVRHNFLDYHRFRNG